MAEKHVAPKHMEDVFTCPNCGVTAPQDWYRLYPDAVKIIAYSNAQLEDLSIGWCSYCKNYTLWLGNILLYPRTSPAPVPVEDMPVTVKADYEEARSIVNASPRGAAAILRLALQKLMSHLGEKGKDLNTDIGNLVKKGLPVRIQQALDAVRVIGNESVHPGVMDLKDDTATALALFDLVNMIVEKMITEPKELEELYQRLPEAKREAIRQRDSVSATSP